MIYRIYWAFKYKVYLHIFYILIYMLAQMLTHEEREWDNPHEWCEMKKY